MSPIPGLRLNVCPKSAVDFVPFFVLITVMPLFYIFQQFFVMPYCFPPKEHPVTFTMIVLLIHFLLFNTIGNFIYILITDTSIRGRVMPEFWSRDAARFCEKCKTYVPFRSHHCPSCDVCILRRDHHCFFCAYCIGQFNFRYFIMFLLYFFLSLFISLPFDLRYAKDYNPTLNYQGIMKFCFPILSYYCSGCPCVSFLILFLCGACCVLCLIGLCLISNAMMVCSGRVTYEMKNNDYSYSKGIMSNIHEILGKRWYLVWIAPFIKSELTSDGIHFDRIR